MPDSPSPPNLDPHIDRILASLLERPNAYLIAIVGIPGSGKSTLCHAMAKRLPDSLVLPMDGYHLLRSELAPETMMRRGAPHTFDSAKLREDLVSLRRNHTGRFPAFDHAKKDPEPDAIHVDRHNSPIIVEGNYLLLKAWDLEDLFDFTIFVECDIHCAMHRVQRRLLDCEIVLTLEAATEQVQTNDFANASLILADGAKERADLTLYPI